MSTSLTTTTKFDRWLRSPASSDAAIYPVRLLLDILPPEVRARIAYFVSTGSQTTQLLALARTNNLQRVAVVDALCYRFSFSTELYPQVLARWIDVFLHDIQQLACKRHCLDGVSAALHPHPIGLWQAPTLRKVVLFDDIKVYDIMRNMSVDEVVIHLDETTDSFRLLDTLSTIRLHSLELICSAITCATCCFIGLASLSESGASIAKSCPFLEVLHLRCTDSHRHKTAKVLWPCVQDILTLEEATVPSSVPNYMEQRVLELRAVEIRDVDGDLFRKTRLRDFSASRITAIRTDDCFDDSCTNVLSECAGVTRLEIRVKAGNERALGTALRSMQNLRELTLTWWREQRANYPVARDLDLFVGNLPLVSRLRLRNVCVTLFDIGSILRQVGSGLVEFEVELLRQKQVPMKQLAALLMLVRKYCPQLQRLTFGGSKLELMDNPRKFNIKGGWAEVIAQLNGVEQALRGLKFHVAMLDTKDVEDLVTTVKQKFVLLSSL